MTQNVQVERHEEETDRDIDDESESGQDMTEQSSAETLSCGHNCNIYIHIHKGDLEYIKNLHIKIFRWH